MNWLERAILAVAPVTAARRAQARRVAMHYDAAVLDARTAHRRASGSDADAANQQRARLAGLARDMIRNTPYAARAQQVIANNVIGDGIIPRIAGVSEDLSSEGLAWIESMLDTTAIDYDGRMNLYGLQRIVMNAVVDAGEALVVHRGTWHGVLTPLHAPGLFAVIDRIGPTANLEEHRYAAPFTIPSG